MNHRIILFSAAILASVGIGRIGIILTRASPSPLVEFSSAPVGENPKAVLPRAALEEASVRLQRQPLLLPPELLAELTNKAFVVMDSATREIVAGRYQSDALPMASLAKLLSALVLVDEINDWDGTLKIEPSDVREGEAVVHPGERMTVADLFAVSLIRSSNTGIAALTRWAGFTEEEMARRMNALALGLGLHSVHSTSSTGLLPTTVASARDVALLLSSALKRNEIRVALSAPEYEWSLYNEDGNPVSRRKTFNTNTLLAANMRRDLYRVRGGKTGYLPESRYNVAVEVELASGDQFIVVVLGASSFDQRFTEVDAIVRWLGEVLRPFRGAI